MSTSCGNKIISNMNYCTCPSSLSLLPGRERLAAYQGNKEAVFRWLRGGNLFSILRKSRDINARTIIGETLLSVACCAGHHTLVEDLLRIECIHLNTNTDDGMTPLMIASKNGHLPCVLLLLSADIQCKLNISARTAEGNTALLLAAKYQHWNIVQAILEASQHNNVDFPVLLTLAAKSKQWEVFRKFNEKGFKLMTKDWLNISSTLILDKDWRSLCLVFKYSGSIFVDRETILKIILDAEWEGLNYVLINYEFENQVMDDVLRKVVKERCWEGVKYLLEHYKYCQNTVLYNLAEASRLKDWLGVEIFLRIVDENAKIDVELLEKIPHSSEEQLREFIYEKNYSYEVMNGVLLASACNVEEDIINTLFNVFHVYDKTTLHNLLIIGILRNNLKILSPLLHYNLNSFTQDNLVSALDLAKRLNYKDVVKILSAAIDEHAKILLSSTSVTFEGREVGQGTDVSLRYAARQRQHGLLQLFVRHSSQQISLSDHNENNQDTYKITSTPRGLVLILNYQRFVDRPELLREGSQFDVINLMNLFNQMGYETQVYWDLTEDQTMSTLDFVRTQPRLEIVDCMILFVMSHGVARQTFQTSDMQCVTVDRLQSMFLDSECPSLRGKPKLFFYNFCRGINEPLLTAHSDAIRETPKDMINVFSAPEGFRSYRYAEAGTPFVISLCRVLSEHACNDDLDDLFRKFKKVYSTSNHGTTPDIQDLNFAKRFFFNPRQ